MTFTFGYFVWKWLKTIIIDILAFFFFIFKSIASILLRANTSSWSFAWSKTFSPFRPSGLNKTSFKIHILILLKIEDDRAWSKNSSSYFLFFHYIFQGAQSLKIHLPILPTLLVVLAIGTAKSGMPVIKKDLAQL